jgi:hypothetical protein
VCSDPEDPTPSCDGSGGYPPNTPDRLPLAPVVITNPDPLDDGLEQDDPTRRPDDAYPSDRILDENSQNWWPDYYIGSVYIPFIAAFPLFGVNVSISIDKYWNWYFSLGFAIGLGPGVNGGGGWFLGPNNDTEEFAEGFQQGHSFNVSGGGGIGIGVNNVNPLYIQSGNEGSGVENIAIEGLITSPGLSGVFGYQWLIYDHGDDTPWIFQGD